MAIQQTQSGGNANGIVSFLFSDDGPQDGTALDGAGFTRTLHQLLGIHEGADATRPDAPLSRELASVITDTEAELAALTAPLGAGLETQANDLKLTAHGGQLQPEADSQDPAQPFWGIAPFADMMAALHEPKPTPDSNSTDSASSATSRAAALKAEHATAPETIAPVFSNGIQHLIELARDAQNASAQLTQQPTANVQMPGTTHGRNRPAGGKALPQVLRPVNGSLHQILAQARGAQAHAKPDTQSAPGSELAASAQTTGNFSNAFADLLSPEPRGQQSAPAPGPTLTHGILDTRADSRMPNLPKAVTEGTLAKNALQLDSQYLAGTEAWFEDLGTRVEWLKDMNIETAELKLHPAELGMLDIQISTGDDGATVSFVTHNAEARALIEESLPKLRELLASQGMQLGQSHVSQQSEGQRRQQDTNPAPAQGGNTAAEETAPVRRTVYIADPNRIDHYV